MKQEKHRCEGSVPDSSGWGYYQCSLNGKYFEDGKYYCEKHAPSKIEEKEQKKSERWARKVAEEFNERRRKLRSVAMKVVAILKENDCLICSDEHVETLIDNYVNKTIK